MLIFGTFLIGKNSSRKNKVPSNELPNKSNYSPSPQKPNKPSTPNQPNNNSEKEIFINAIKTDLKNMLKKLAGEKDKIDQKIDIKLFGVRDSGSVFYMLSKEMLGVNEITLFDEEADYFEKGDYQEIVSLIHQVKQLKEKRRSELIQEVDDKLKNNENLFIYIPIGKNTQPFYGKKNGLDFIISVPENHFSLTNINLCHQVKGMEKIKDFYLIEGDINDFVKIPTNPPHYTGDPYYWKEVSLGDKISITHVNK